MLKYLVNYVCSAHIAYRKVEDEDVGGVPHGLVEEHHEHHEEVADEADDDDEGEEDGHHDGDDEHEGLEVLAVIHVHAAAVGPGLQETLGQGGGKIHLELQTSLRLEKHMVKN